MFIKTLALTFCLFASPSLVRVDALDVRKEGMTATIVGPSTLLERLDGCRRDKGTRLDWGDGTTYVAPGRDCRGLRTHTYKSAGHFRIKASFVSDGPSGQAIVDWESDVEFVAK